VRKTGTFRQELRNWLRENKKEETSTMRNLQKILALALALIMSFSLVATAGAFSDDGDISDSYKTAVNVLNGLEVFKGYDNGATFQPKGNITRAEVAAIIYRIATGDVTDSQASIYSTYGQFTDVADGSWYAGYVNYCANAGYIKGRGNKIFDPQGQVTGYEALAMILRAVGYDKNGEFTGSNWQIRTASIANQRGITKNVTEGMLGQAATRETVAEILFRAILVNQVDFSANTLSYTEKATSLGYDSLKLEEIEGVITANEYADLNEDDTLPDGRTEMLVDGKDYTIDYTTTLDDIGESHIAYIQNGKKVLAINDREEGNATAESTAKIKDEDALKAFAKENSISLNDTAERYINFSKGYRWMSDWRIRYEINFVSDSTDVTERTGAAWREYEGDRSDYGWTVELKDFQKAAVPFTDANGTHYRWTYSAEFKANEEISSKHQENIKAIFDHADRFNRVEDNRDGYSYGEVYAGTSSLKDLSDSMSYKQFVTEYINQDTEAKVEANEKGNWVKVIDNDKDGVAEYVLKVVYTTAQVSKVSDSSYTLDTKDIKLTDGDEINELESEKVVTADTLAVDDVVYYALIDGKAQTYKAEPVTAKIDKINRNDLTATTADGTVYEEAGVHEHIYNPDYVKPVTEMAGGVSYDMFLGRGGYLLAFVKSAAKSFTLLVDGYYNSSSKGDQYAVKAYQDGRIVNVDLNRNGGMFIDKNANGVLNNGWNAMRELGQSANWLNAKGNALKTTVAGLDEDGNLIPVDFGSVYERGSHAMIAFPKNAVSSTQEKYYTSIVEDAYTTGTAYVTGNSSVAYNALANTNDVNNRVEVRALSSTIYYFVWESKNDIRVQQYVGYGDLPNLSTEEMKKIEDIYAVGTQRDRVSTSADRTSTYYTADVVVVEFAEPYTEFAERILLVDTPVVSAGIQIDEVEVIRGNGAKETLRIDLTDSKIRNYNIAGKKGAQPGIYNLYPTNEEGLYTIESLTADEVAKTGVFSVGNVSTERYTADTNYLEVNTLAYGTERDFNGADYKQYKLTADTKYYTLNYNNKWDATLTESSLNTVLAPRVNESDRVFKNGDFFHDLDRVFPEQKLYGCYNNILVGGNTDNDTAVYVVSFENYDEDMYNNGDGGHVHYADYAQTVWQSLIPSIVAGKTEAPAVELRSGVNGTETVKVLSANATTTITFAEWVKFANQADLLYVTPQPNHTIAISGLTTFTDKSIPVDTMERVIPAVSITEDVKGTIRVLTQVSGGITETFTYDYILKAPNHESALPAAQLPLSKDSVLLNGQRYVNLEAFVLAFGVPSGATATWTFESERGETFTIVTKDGKVVTNNAPADIDILSEVKDNFSVVITAECGGEGAVNHTTSYDSTVIPKDPTKYNDAKAAYEAALPLDQADEAALNAAKTAIEAALAADNASNLEDGQKAELEGWLAEVEAALTPETTTVKVNVTGLRVDQETSARTPFSFDADVANGEFTVRDLAFLEGMDADAWIPVAMWNDDVTILGVGTIQDGKKSWTVKGIPAGTTEINLTVIYATPDELKDLPPIIPPMPAARMARAAAGTTPVYIKTWLADGKVPGVHSVTNPVDGVEVEPNFAFASQVAQEDGYTLWMILVIIHQGNLSKDEIVNMGINFDAKPDVPGPDDLTQAKADAAKAVNEYKTAEIAALTGDDAAAAEKAKTDALAAIEAAESVDAINKAVADYKAAIDALTAVTDNKLVVEAVTGRTPLIEGDSMIAANIQDGIQIAKQADGTTYNVTGNVFYTTWSKFSTSNPALQSGYYVALKLTHPDVDSSMILLNREGSTKYLTDDGILVYRVNVKDNKADSFTATVMLDDGTREVSTIDLSGLTLGENTSELTVEAVDPSDKSADTWGVDVADLQSNVTVDPAENGIIKVHGTAKYFEGKSGSTWDTNWGTLKTGYFVALKLNFPGVADNGIRIFYTDDNGNPKDDNDEANYRDTGDGGIVLWRIKPSTAMKPINNIKVVAEGKTYTIDISDVTLRGTTVVIEPVTDDSIDLLGKKASDLQSDIVVSGPVGNRFTVTGTAKYIKDWTKFDSDPDEDSGNFVALQIAWPGVQNSKIEYGWAGTDLTPVGMDGLFVFRLQNGKTHDYIMRFKTNGITYEADLSGIACEPNPEESLVIDAPRQNESTVGGGSVSQYNVEAVSVEGYTVSGGRLGYQQKDSDEHGYYVALYITKDNAAVSKIYWREAGTSDEGEPVTAQSGVCLLPVKVGADMFRDNEQYTSLEIAPEASSAADWDNSVVVDLSGLTNLGREATAITIDSYDDVGNSNGEKASTFQEDVVIEGSGTEYTVRGRLNYISNNDEYADPEDKGYYAIIALDTGLSDKTITYHVHTTTDGRATTAPDGESHWRAGEEHDGRLELMSLLTNTYGDGTLNKTTHVWFDGIKYTINWNMTLNQQPMDVAALDIE